MRHTHHNEPSGSFLVGQLGKLGTGATMDNVTLIRVVAGTLAVVVLVILIYLTKKKAPR